MCVLCFCFVFACGVNADVTVKVTVSIDGKKAIAKTDENFVCATLDLWPSTKCDFGVCSWGKSSILNIDLNNNILKNAVKAFEPLRLRLGGTLQDRLTYQTDAKEPCDSTFVYDTHRILDYKRACLPLARWDELNSFISETGAEYVFGLNALSGKTIEIKEVTGPNGELEETTTAVGAWNYTNAKSLIEYTLKKGYKIHGWTLGNELGGETLFIGVPPKPYSEDTESLRKLLEEIYSDVGSTPLIIAPGSIFDKKWYSKYIEETTNDLNVTTHHIYNLGSGNDDDLVETIMSLSYVEETTKTFDTLENVLKESETEAVAWVGESGGAFSSGKVGVSNAFVDGFWYLNMLGLSATYNTKAYCRQTLIGGNYGLLDTNTFIPNPDYYSALLWHRLMGSTVLKIEFKETTKNFLAYAHCAKNSTGVTILMLNLDGNTTFKASIDSATYGTKREEYHLTPMGGDIYSRSVMLNGNILTVGPDGVIPKYFVQPAIKKLPIKPVKVAPYSFVFVHLPEAKFPACTNISFA